MTSWADKVGSAASNGGSAGETGSTGQQQTSVSDGFSRKTDGAPVANGNSGRFQIDSGVSRSKRGRGKGKGKNRQLEKYYDSSNVHETLEDTEGDEPWDQFATNKELYGIEATPYDEAIYTTALDKTSDDYKNKLAEAERIARKIKSQVSSNIHVMEERGIMNRNVPEEELYSTVLSDNKTVAPSSGGSNDTHTSDNSAVDAQGGDSQSEEAVSPNAALVAKQGTPPPPLDALKTPQKDDDDVSPGLENGISDLKLDDAEDESQKAESETEEKKKFTFNVNAPEFRPSTSIQPSTSSHTAPITDPRHIGATRPMDQPPQGGPHMAAQMGQQVWVDQSVPFYQQMQSQPGYGYMDPASGYIMQDPANGAMYHQNVMPNQAQSQTSGMIPFYPQHSTPQPFMGSPHSSGMGGAIMNPHHAVNQPHVSMYMNPAQHQQPQPYVDMHRQPYNNPESVVDHPKRNRPKKNPKKKKKSKRKYKRGETNKWWRNYKKMMLEESDPATVLDDTPNGLMSQKSGWTSPQQGGKWGSHVVNVGDHVGES